jgi:hypothetical protein
VSETNPSKFIEMLGFTSFTPAYMLHLKPLKNQQNPFHLSKSLKSFSRRMMQFQTGAG